jgi:hypothetical protein
MDDLEARLGESPTPSAKTCNKGDGAVSHVDTPSPSHVSSSPSQNRSSRQERPVVSTNPPIKFRRIASANKRWGLSRTLAGYKAGMPSVGGKAPKWVLTSEYDPNDFYIAKLGATNGRAETFTELFNNQLGEALGFEMAHSGVARLDGDLYFLTRNFRAPGERLVHGSLMIEEIFGAKQETDRIHYKSEQSFYGVDFLRDVINAFCKDDASTVFERFIEMLVFDALIGSMDRHAQNWGVLQQTRLPQRYRFAPIFDSARALLWLLPERKLVEYDTDVGQLRRYVDASKPCIGPPGNHPKVNACNHFDVVESLVPLYPHPMEAALAKVSSTRTTRVAGKLLDSFPYFRYLSALRRKLMLRVLKIRADKLIGIAQQRA